MHPRVLKALKRSPSILDAHLLSDVPLVFAASFILFDTLFLVLSLLDIGLFLFSQPEGNTSGSTGGRAEIVRGRARDTAFRCYTLDL